MTGFDETVPPDETTADEDATAAPTAGNDLDEVAPEHDSKNPAIEDEPTADEPGGEPMGGDDDLISGHYGPTAT